MIVRMSIFQKRHNLTTQEFQSYWKDIHGPIAAKIPGLAQYEQNHVVNVIHLSSNLPQGSHSLDGICRLMFEDESAMQGVLKPEITKILQEDEAKFIEGLQTVVIRQNPVVPIVDELPLVKCISLIRRHRDLTFEAFEHEWDEIYAGYLKQIEGLKRYTQNYVTGRSIERKPATYEQMPIDCIDELYFEDIQSLEAAMTSDKWQKTMAQAETLIEMITSYIVNPHNVFKVQ
ncbi:EthD domain-containing protein [Neobacillus rhizophilus]|uniref:EthD family reductase n=1 Tax=Neobacillus rhizophilus TaxID=2833579 RepID=A0A942U594_9BACI|nr:EthD family reductase [Neobacillus rhizophilus]MBS4214960.1 EthD family reductase [Neobacillus rhizophilus]